MTLEECLNECKFAIEAGRVTENSKVRVNRTTLIFLVSYIEEITVQLEHVKGNLKSMFKDLKEYMNDTDKSN